MFKRLLKPALILLVVLVVCWVLISPAVDLEPGTLRSLQFVALFAFLLGWLAVSALCADLCLQLHCVEAVEIATHSRLRLKSANVSCILLC